MSLKSFAASLGARRNPDHAAKHASAVRTEGRSFSIICPSCKEHTDAYEPCCGDDRDYVESLRDWADVERG